MSVRLNFHGLAVKTKRIYDRVEAETRKSQTNFQSIQVSSVALRFPF